MAKLSDNLRKASFRGVPFFIDGGDRTAGRRVQLHEYPQRDEPYPEDLGRASRKFGITGFVIGTDYIAAANALVTKCEEPGPGQLVHPWLGTLSVVLVEPARISFSKALGQATIEMQFVEAGKLANPAATDSTAKQSGIAADALSTAAAGDFVKKYITSGFPDSVVNGAIADINKIYGVLAQPQIPGLAILNLANTALTAARSALLLVNDPVALCFAIQSVMGVANIVGQVTQGAYLVSSVLRLADHGSLAPIATPAGATPSSQQQYANTNALNALTRQTLLAQAAGLSSTVPADVYDDMIVMRNTLNDALDSEADTATDDVYQALIDARTAVWTDITSRARNAARLTSLTPTAVLPMLAIVQEYYGDATRADEVIARNNVRHPLFVPVSPLKVLQVV